jgi:hypothetical protein
MQNSGATIEFTPAKRFAFGSRDIDNLFVGKAIGANLAIIGDVGRCIPGKRSTDTRC